MALAIYPFILEDEGSTGVVTWYSNGQYANYTVQWSQPIPGTHSLASRLGTVNFYVNGDTIFITTYAPDFYSQGESLDRTVAVHMSGRTLYYNGTLVKLPFYCGGRNVISCYSNSYSNVTSKIEVTNTLQGGLIEFQPVTYVSASDSILFYGNDGNFRQTNIPITYEYGTTSMLLFFLDGSIGPDPVLSYVLGFNETTTYLNGTSCTTPVQASLSLQSTNINLGPVNYAFLILSLLVIGLPMEIPVAVVAIGIVGLRSYNRRKSRKQFQAQKKERRKNANRHRK